MVVTVYIRTICYMVREAPVKDNYFSLVEVAECSFFATAITNGQCYILDKEMRRRLTIELFVLMGRAVI